MVLGAWSSLGRPFPDDVKEFLAAAVSFAAILVGFLATAQAILRALPADSVMAKIKASDYIDDLVGYLKRALLALLAFTVVSLLGFFSDLKDPPPWFVGFHIASVFRAAYSIFAFYRVSSVIMTIMRMRG